MSDQFGTLAFWQRKQAREAAMRDEDEEPEQTPSPAGHRPVLRDEKGRLLPGQPSLNPRGGSIRRADLKAELGRRVIEDVLTDWDSYGPDAIRRTRIEKPEVYLQVVAKLLPKEVKLTGDHATMLDHASLDALNALRHELAQAVALARTGTPVTIPPALEALTREPDDAADPEGSGP